MEERLRQCLLAAFIFMDVWKRREAAGEAAAPAAMIGKDEVASIEIALRAIGPWAMLIGRPLMHPLVAENLSERNLYAFSQNEH